MTSECIEKNSDNELKDSISMFDSDKDEQNYKDTISELLSEIEKRDQKILELNKKCHEQETAINRTFTYARGLNDRRSYKISQLIKKFFTLFIAGSIPEKRYYLSLYKAALKGEGGRAFVRDDGENVVMNIAMKLIREETESIIKEKPKANKKKKKYLPANVNKKTAQILKQDYSKYDVIIFSVIDYDFRFQRPQHFAKRFAADGHRVFYIDANFEKSECVKEIEPNLFQVDFNNYACRSIYFNESSKNFNNWLEKKMDDLIYNYAINDAVIVLDYPNWIDTAIKLRQRNGFKIIADYMDDATGFIGTTTDVLRNNCEIMLKEADIVIPSSDFLEKIALNYTDKTQIIRNGTEVEHFKKASTTTLSKTTRKIVGYYGAVSHWFAYEKICYAASKLPEVDFVIIGEVTAYKKELEKHVNIKLLGEKKYEELPEYLADFDVCLIPFDTTTDLIKATNPVKFYEYLSTGKKVVATEIPELIPYSGKYVLMSNDDEGFLLNIKKCLNNEDGLASKNECMKFAAENDWQHRYELFSKACASVFPDVEIIVLTYNNLNLNKYCINSILSQTAYPKYTLTIVDNLSTDGTREYLSELDAKKYNNVNVILNDENLGFAGGNNEAIKKSNAKYCVLLNNDTIVTRGWITSFVKHMENDATLGMAGAVTNAIGNEQKIQVYYQDTTELKLFAHEYTNMKMGEEYSDIDRIPLFATIIRGDILRTIGMLDSSYKVGMFEDDDFSMLVRRNDYRITTCEDVFVHHVSNASFKKLTEGEYTEIFNKNKEIYEKKWNVVWTMPKYREDVYGKTNSTMMIEPKDKVEK